MISDYQAYIFSFTAVCLFALWRVTGIALLAISRAIPDRGFKDQ